MDNDEMLVVIKDMFEKSIIDIKKEVKTEIAEVKNHMGVLAEKLQSDIKVIAEGHGILNSKLDNLCSEMENTKNELENVKSEIKILKTEMSIVKDYVIGVDAKLNEHEVILKRVK